MEQLSGHACWVNGKALMLVGADLPTAGDPPGGHIERDHAGRPTGILSDGAMEIVQKHIAPLPPSIFDEAFGSVLRDCARHGLTGVHDMMADRSDVKLLQQRQSQGRLTLRVYAMRHGAESSPDDPFVTSDDGLLTVKGVKFFADGAIGSWSAAMLQPYDDKPGSQGTLVYTSDAFLGNVSAWASKGYQIATHAIGDAANREVLNVYERLLTSDFKGRDLRWRIEHSQILTAADLPRFASLGVVPSMQPSHCASDLGYAEQRLGFDRAALSYAWKSLLQTGIPALPFGSDFPTAGSVPPLLGFHAAVTRETSEGLPVGGWFPSERVTRVQALKSYTADAAYASFREHQLGAIQSGYYADLTVFDRDILTIDKEQILSANVIGTIVGGRVTYAQHPPLAKYEMMSSASGAARGEIPFSTEGNSEVQQRWEEFRHDAEEDYQARSSLSGQVVNIV